MSANSKITMLNMLEKVITPLAKDNQEAHRIIAELKKEISSGSGNNGHSHNKTTPFENVNRPPWFRLSKAEHDRKGFGPESVFFNPTTKHALVQAVRGDSNWSTTETGIEILRDAILGKRLNGATFRICEKDATGRAGEVVAETDISTIFRLFEKHRDNMSTGRWGFFLWFDENFNYVPMNHDYYNNKGTF